TKDVLLKTTGQNGTSISWYSNAPAFVAGDGRVTRPTYTQGDQTVTLTATITKNGAVDTKVFTLKLPKLAMSDSEAVGFDKAGLEIGYSGQDNQNSITNDVVLKTTGQFGTTISWSSNSPGFVAADGKVTRPTYTQGDQTVILTATINRGAVTETKSFTLILPHLPMSDAEAVGIEKASLAIGYNGLDNADRVKQDVILKTTGQNDTIISWSSNYTGYISTEGKVIRPSYYEGNLRVTLTATITRGKVSDTKTFTLTLIKMPNPPVKEPVAEELVVNVISGNGTNEILVQTTIKRTTDGNGVVKDNVHISKEKALETIEKLNKMASKTATMVLPDGDDKVSETTITMPKETVKAFLDAGIHLEIFTENGRILVLNESFSNIKEDLYFRVVPIKNVKESDEIKTRAKQDPIVRGIGKDSVDSVQVLGRPMEIDTNMQNRHVTLTFPIGMALPTDPNARKEMLDNLVIYVEHSDGTKEVLQGKAVEFKNGTLGIEFDVSKFSTFTMLYLKGAKDYFTKEALNHQSYIKGYADGNFQPNASITRAQMAAMLSRNLGLNYTGNGEPSYVDTPKNYWAFIEIELVKQAGIMTGSVNGTFRPQATITRAEMATIALRWLQKECKADADAYPFCSKLVSKETVKFKDISDKHWAKEAIEMMALTGIMQGYEDNTFHPEEKLTRAQAVKVLNRLFKRGPLNGATIQTFKDVPVSHWAYKEIEEAAQNHSYILNEKGEEELK
ncbi:immunoglobulin-like domain-containing protein, partial [Pseudoneobacillus sp. C159]